MHRAIAALILAVALLTAPAAALAQSAGDEQYVDPFEGEGGGGQQQEQEQQPQAQEPPAAEPAPAPAPAEPAPAESTEAEVQAAPAQTPALPRTGLAVVPLLVAGLTLLAGGTALRRRL